MPDDFLAGEAGDNGPVAPEETVGARLHISVSRPQRGVQAQLRSNYLMPSVHGRNGSLEKVDPAITLTPLGGMMPGPNAIAPALPIQGVGAAQSPQETAGPFGAGVNDSYPEGCPVPVTEGAYGGPRI